MRDLVAGAIAVVLLVIAASLGTTLHVFRKQRRRAREHEQGLGRRIVAEIPAESGLTLFTEDVRQFHYGARAIDKDGILGARILINGAAIATCASGRRATRGGLEMHADAIDDRPEGIARDRWDVVIDARDGAVIVECGAIRERVSQELARAVFDAVKADLKRQDGEPGPR